MAARVLNRISVGERRKGRPRRTWGQTLQDVMASRQSTDEDTEKIAILRVECGKGKRWMSPDKRRILK